MKSFDRSLSVIFSADIVGYTSMMQNDEQGTLEILEHFEHVIRSETQKHKGEIIKTFGDGCLVLFSSAVAAINCAIEIQTSFKSYPKVPLRIGIHIGEIVHKDHDIFGDGVNIASRIESMGIANSILISSEVYNQIRNKRELQTVKLGAFEFKNVERDIDLYAIINNELSIPKVHEMRGKGKLKSTSKLIKYRAFILILLPALALLAFILRGKIWQSERSNSTLSDDQLSIAVLAFKDLSEKKDQEYFSDGISEAILELLSKIPDLKVISSTSSFSYKHRQAGARVIGNELGVTHLLDGSVRKSENEIRIATKLVNAKDGSQLWDNQYQFEPSDVFRIQDEIAGSVARQLKLAFSEEKINSENVEIEAYKLFLKASYIFNEISTQGILEADNIVRIAIQKDSSYAPSWTLLARIADKRSRNYSQLAVDEGHRIAIVALEKALTLDPESAKAYAVLASIYGSRGDFVKAQDNLLQAQSIDPNDPLVISVGSSYNFYAGKLEEALRLGELALSMDPLEAAHYFSLGLNCYFLKRYDESLQYLEQYNILKPEAAIHHGISSIVYTLMEDFQKALEEAEKETSDEFRLFARSNAYYGLGQTELSDSLLHDYIDKYASASKNIVAVCYAFRHDYDKAFFWLDKAFEEDEGSLYESINYVYFSNLYDDPRWGQLIEKMKLPSGHWLVERMNEGRK